MNTHDTYSRMCNTEYLTKTDIQKTFRYSTEHKIIIYLIEIAQK